MVNFIMLIFAGLFTETKEKENTGGFTIDQRGRYVAYYEENTRQIEEDLNLLEYISEFFKAKVVQRDESGSGRITIKGKAVLKKHVGIGNYIAGDLCYKLIFEKTTDGYRCWFTDLAYQPYIKDRYGKIVAAKVKPIPLEKKASKVNEHTWNKQREFAHYTINALSIDFNTYLQKNKRIRELILP